MSLRGEVHSPDHWRFRETTERKGLSLGGAGDGRGQDPGHYLPVRSSAERGGSFKHTGGTPIG